MQKQIIRLVNKATRNSLLQHILFWAIAYFILLNIFSGSSRFQRIDYIYTSIFLASLFIPVAINLFVCIPKLLDKKRYLLYGFIFLINLFVFSLFNQLLFDNLIDYILPGFYFISYYSYFDILKFFIVFLIITTLIKLSKEWFELSEARQKIILLEKEKIDVELKALTNQVNPHFLFNSLNVLYSLSLNNRKETSDAIIKLSDIMRYVIYDSTTELVPLKSEIDLINNYIHLQRFRTEAKAKIKFHTDVKDESVSIAPMLLLPLVENSFKHGIKGDVANTFININLTSTNKSIHFSIENNKGEADDIEQQKSGGVGLENIKSRLQLIYPESYTFEIKETDKSFRVELSIKTGK